MPSGGTLPDVVTFEAGEVVASKTRDFGSGNIDIRLMDARVSRGNIVNPDPHTYGPSQIFAVIDQKMIELNEEFYEFAVAAPFMTYFEPDERDKWLRFMRMPPASKPPLTAFADMSLGTPAVDLPGKLQGIWFNPKVYDAELHENGEGKYDNKEAAALTIFERAGDSSRVQIARGPDHLPE